VLTISAVGAACCCSEKSLIARAVILGSDDAFAELANARSNSELAAASASAVNFQGTITVYAWKYLVCAWQKAIINAMVLIILK
jgi:hypothetical protein